MIISVCNTKGGCGKTSISAGISGAFAKRGKKVLHIDADPQGGSTSSLELGSGVDLANSLAGVLIGESTIHDVIVKTKIPGLWGVPSAKQMEELGYQIRWENDEYVGTLLTALKEVEKSYDYIVIDAPNSVSPIMENVAFATDIVVVPFEGIDSVRRIGDLEDIMDRTRPDKGYIRLDIYNMLSRRSEAVVRRKVDEKFEEYNIPKPTFEIRTSSPMAQIGDEGGSICHFRPKCAAAMDIMKLTHLIEEKLGLSTITEKTVSEILAEAHSNQ